MKNNFEEKLNQMMNEEKEIPTKVRQSIDESYAYIRGKSKQKKGKFIWKRTVAAACALIIAGVMMTNEQVMAGINGLFSFGDEGIKQAIHNGFAQENDSETTDQNIHIMLENYFADDNKIGMSFQLEFDDVSVLKDIEDISMDFRLKNGDGEYIEEYIPDTKPLKGNNNYISGIEFNVAVLDVEKGNVQFDIVMESNHGDLPTLQDAVVEVESVNLFKSIDAFDEITGNWKLKVDNYTKERPASIQYVMQDTSSVIQVTEVTANPTSLQLTFSIDEIYEDENTFANNMSIIDENNNEY